MASRSSVALAFGVTVNSASHALQRLARAGAAARHGGGQGARYVATEVYPDDMRGTALATLVTLQKHTRAKPRGIPAHRF